MRARRRAVASSLLMCVLALSGCGNQVAVPPTSAPLPSPVLTVTPSIGFAVVVTPVADPRATTTPAPTSTPFVVPHGPYIQLIPATGPPESRWLIVRGGHFPQGVGVQLGWSADGAPSRVTTGAGTDKHGNLSTRFFIPASPPGTYRVMLTIGGARYATARYVVRSAAVLHARAASTGKGETIQLRGAGFLPNLKLLLVVYPIDVQGKPVTLGMARCGARGSFKYSATVHTLPLGQYIVRAWSDDAMAAQMAETYFQVVI